MSTLKNLCVFMGSSEGNHPDYVAQAKELGMHLAEKNIELIYGGGNVGIMGELSRSVLSNGGKVTGVIPKKIYDMVEHVDLTHLHIVEHMHERKAKMYELADGFIALPGGIGTLEEVAEVMTWFQIGYHSKPIGLFNVQQFYTPLLHLLEHMIKEGFLKKEFLQNVIIEDNFVTLLQKMNDLQTTFVDKWSN
ncbi:TIGR00730 family Rossman fold protein [Bacillus suaedaesalsae]|uniref:Cytokinin riboside 5'-monophosphate phosphoribohydrolase n=1 Tax=Bacillus suaedaesalsae TaxID=2810349 RepID=A0ABS2DEG5_9BACI|nr:TIGR00730 family Rossman fold protein [Bacillus suaedaesalsae]MBM6616842.1 TIGR00730 family Rossman fold protein [Bacillus suaedaesalsae]